MMHGHEKSGVALKQANNAERSVAEPVERRAEAKGNAGQQGTHRTQSRVMCHWRWTAYGKRLPS